MNRIYIEITQGGMASSEFQFQFVVGSIEKDDSRLSTNIVLFLFDKNVNSFLANILSPLQCNEPGAAEADSRFTTHHLPPIFNS